jgi:hypothetical protein
VKYQGFYLGREVSKGDLGELNYKETRMIKIFMKARKQTKNDTKNEYVSNSGK